MPAYDVICPICGEDTGMAINNQPFCINCISQELAVSNFNDDRIRTWKHQPDLPQHQPHLCGVQFDGDHKTSTRPATRLNYTTMVCLAVLAFPAVVYWLHGCS